MQRLSAGVVLVRMVAGQPHFLLLRAYGYWDFPKGEVEPGEAPLQAARREVHEETGLSGLRFRWGEECRETPPYARGKIARYYLAEAPRGDVRLGVNPVTGVREHHEFRWLPYAQAQRLLSARLRPILAWAQATVAQSAART